MSSGFRFRRDFDRINIPFHSNWPENHLNDNFQNKSQSILSQLNCWCSSEERPPKWHQFNDFPSKTGERSFIPRAEFFSISFSLNTVRVHCQYFGVVVHLRLNRFKASERSKRWKRTCCFQTHFVRQFSSVRQFIRCNQRYFTKSITFNQHIFVQSKYQSQLL